MRRLVGALMALGLGIRSPALAVVGGTNVTVESGTVRVALDDPLYLPMAGCNNATASPFWDLPTSLAPTPTCVTGANTQKAYLRWPDSDGAFSAQTHLRLPANFSGTMDVTVIWKVPVATTGNAFFQVSTICSADNDSDDPAFNAASTLADAVKASTQLNDALITPVTKTGCAAGKIMWLKLMRDRTNASDTLGAQPIDILGVEVVTHRTP